MCIDRICTFICLVHQLKFYEREKKNETNQIIAQKIINNHQANERERVSEWSICVWAKMRSDNSIEGSLSMWLHSCRISKISPSSSLWSPLSSSVIDDDQHTSTVCLWNPRQIDSHTHTHMHTRNRMNI